MKKHEIVTYKDIGKKIDKPRLILLNHIPKTGGTSVSKLIRDNINGDFFTVEGYHDWIKLKENQKKYEGKDLFCDGAVWGIENVFEEPKSVMYITMLRDPLLVFRSNFSYSKSHYNHISSDLKKYLYEYNMNFLIYVFANNDLKLAKKRLLSHYYFFGITEYAKESSYLLSKILNFELHEYKQQNKSNSEKYKIEIDLKEEFYKNNKLDYKFYSYANNLFLKRLEDFSLFNNDEFKNIKEIIDKNSYPTVSKDNKKDYQNKITTYINECKYDKAIILLEEIEMERKSNKYYTDHRKSLAICYEKIGKIEEAEKYYLKIFDAIPSQVINHLINFYIKYDKEKAINLIKNEICILERIIYSSPNDCNTYFHLTSLVMNLYKIYFKLKKYDDAIQLLKKEKKRIIGLGLHKSSKGNFYRIIYLDINSLLNKLYRKKIIKNSLLYRIIKKVVLKNG